MEVKADQLKDKEHKKEEKKIKMTAAVVKEMAWVNQWLRRRRSMKMMRKEEKERKEERVLG